MSTYLELQTQFLALLNRRDCTTDQANAFLQNSLVRIERKLRCPAMEKSLLVTIAIGYTGLVIPSDFLELINLIPTTTGGTNQVNPTPLEKCDISRAITLAQDVGTPQVYSRQGGLWVLAPMPAVGDIVRIDYYAELTDLVNPSDTNIISLIAPDMIIYGALGYAADFFVDDRRDSWEARFMEIKTDLEEVANDDEEHGAAAVQPAFVYPTDLNTEGWPFPLWT